MTTAPCLAKTTTFYQLLDQTPGLDARDNRGKRHTIALILSGLLLALCAGRDGKLSGLHRHMVNHHKALCEATQQPITKPISRAQLPVLLAKVNGVLFAQLLFKWCGLSLDVNQKRWFAVDGKELKGSIEAGHTRSEACVSALAHDSEQILNQAYYNGSKESERPTVRQLLNDAGLYNQKLSLDALHLIPLTLNAVDGAGGIYVVGVKSNQAHLYRYCICNALFTKATHQRQDAPQRGHGRIDQRQYACFAVNSPALDIRWKDAGITALVRVKRVREDLAGKSLSEEVSYFLSNTRPATELEADDLFDAIRRHWRVEVMHHQRDVSLSEDALRTGSAALSRLMSSLRTLPINLLKRTKAKNIAAQLDEFADKFHVLLEFMTQQLVL